MIRTKLLHMIHGRVEDREGSSSTSALGFDSNDTRVIVRENPEKILGPTGIMRAIANVF